MATDEWHGRRRERRAKKGRDRTTDALEWAGTAVRLAINCTDQANSALRWHELQARIHQSDESDMELVCCATGQTRQPLALG